MNAVGPWGFRLVLSQIKVTKPYGMTTSRLFLRPEAPLVASLEITLLFRGAMVHDSSLTQHFIQERHYLPCLDHDLDLDLLRSARRIPAQKLACDNISPANF